MAPRETNKATPKIERTVSKMKVKASPVSTTKKNIAMRKLVEATPVKVTTMKLRTAVPSTPKPKENKPVSAPRSVTKSGKKLRRPKKAHSGVPVPSKMLKMMGKQLQEVVTV